MTEGRRQNVVSRKMVPWVPADLVGGEADQSLSGLAKALAHPIRVKILRFLSRKSLCYCGQIVDEFPLAQSTVSQHLKVLKEAGLICGSVEGVATCYCINRETIRKLKVLVAAL